MEQRWLFDISNPRALLVVAHPDDETIFAGGLILCSRLTHWAIICCATEYEQRQHEFLATCRFLAKESGNRIYPIVLGLMDGQIDHRALARYLRSYTEGYDIVITHNREGEYGHEDHKVVHRYVVDVIANPNTWVFISRGSTNVNQERLKSKMPGGNFVLSLPPEIRRLKIRAFQECHVSQANLYGYDKTGKLRNTDLRETLYWYFEDPAREEYTFYK